MFKWFWPFLGQSNQSASGFDVVYGYPKKAVAEWLQWNPQLKAEHQAAQSLADIGATTGLSRNARDKFKR